MGRLKNNWFKRQKGQAIADKAVKEDEKDKRERQAKYALLRCDYDIDCLKIGIVEKQIIEYKRDGIFPATVPMGVTKEDAQTQENHLRNVRRDMVRMLLNQVGVEVSLRIDECHLCGQGNYEPGHVCPPKEDNTAKPEAEQDETKSNTEQDQTNG